MPYIIDGWQGRHLKTLPAMALVLPPALKASYCLARPQQCLVRVTAELGTAHACPVPSPAGSESSSLNSRTRAHAGSQPHAGKHGSY